ncbi:MAG: CDP-diacylglycerol--serine O-phosphatidyltransferase [Planctomycetaceae bacterium]|nr:CDP-diacylglycerol--serine O-phosphatidyltransferase [Planctomycetaceae bacterium]|tara:strand:- start:1572 stop:2483 length:912 start_codon:yes stop_codon:yes gene_type:complete
MNYDLPQDLEVNLEDDWSDDSKFPILPTLMTLGNAICGLTAVGLATKAVGIRLAAESMENAAALPLDPGAYEALRYAGALIFLGMLFDALDGQVARLLNQTSKFGMELDSLCDVITFGVAPAFIMLFFADIFHPRLMKGAAGIYTLCAILRLARYNVEADEDADTSYFRGLPSPAAAGTIATFAMAMPDIMLQRETILESASLDVYQLVMLVVPPLTVVLAWLMVSGIRYPHLAKQLAKKKSMKRHYFKIVQILFAVIFALVFQEIALPVIFLYYLLATPLTNLWRKFFGARDKALVKTAESS